MSGRTPACNFLAGVWWPSPRRAVLGITPACFFLAGVGWAARGFDYRCSIFSCRGRLAQHRQGCTVGGEPSMLFSRRGPVAQRRHVKGRSGAEWRERHSLQELLFVLLVAFVLVLAAIDSPIKLHFVLTLPSYRAFVGP